MTKWHSIGFAFPKDKNGKKFLSGAIFKSTVNPEDNTNFIISKKISKAGAEYYDMMIPYDGDDDPATDNKGIVAAIEKVERELGRHKQKFTTGGDNSALVEDYL